MNIPTQSHPFQAPYEIEFMQYKDTVETFANGLQASVRPELPGYNSILLCAVIVMILLVVFNIRKSPRFFMSFMNDLVSARERSNIFNERTLNETRIIVVLILQLCVCEALLLFPLLRYAGLAVGGDRAPTIVAVLGGVALCYYLWQLAMYHIIGYVFAGRYETRRWVRGFNASQILLGWMLLLPALLALFYPASSEYVLPVAGILFLLSRIIFFYKGFRIFYQGFSSLLYFILYLCSVEIVPVVIMCYGIISLCCNQIC